MKKDGKKRVWFLLIFCTAVFAAFLVRLYWMQFTMADHYAKKLEQASQTSYTVRIPAARGSIVDRSGRFAGIAGEHGTVSPAGSGAGAVPALVGQALGTLTRQNGVLWVTGLPCNRKAAAGELAVTAQGQYWAGQLAAAPQPDPGGLTLRAPLEDTADETDCLYFIGG